MYMILCVIDQSDLLNSVLKAWQQLGIPEITILESSGLHSLSQHVHIPLRYSFGDSSQERGNNTLLAIVEKEETIQSCLEITESIVGDFSGPNTGIFVAWALDFAKGVIGKQPHLPA
jgi:hypothetical protein